MRRRRLTVLLALILLSAGASGQPTNPDRIHQFDRTRLGWDRMELSATKYFVSMRVTMDLSTALEQGVGNDLRNLHTSELGNDEHSGLSIRYMTDGLGRRSNVQLVIDSGSGKALRRTSLETGSKHKYRQYLLGKEDVLRLTRRPQDGEESRSAKDWSRVSEERIDYPSGTRATVTEAGALIYLIAASHLEQPGDSFEILTLASDEFHWVKATVKGLDGVNLDYREESPAGTTRKTLRDKAIRIVLSSRPVRPSHGDRFELLGLRDIELFLDPRSRALFQLRGKVDYFGRITFVLDGVSLISADFQAGPTSPQ